MKAKDIALLCTAAAGAGAAAGAAMTAKNKTGKPAEKKAAVKVKSEKPEKPVKYSLSAIESRYSDQPVYSEGIHPVFICRVGKENTAWKISDSVPEQVRCPSGVISAAAADECTLFITGKGGIFVYSDPEREPVFCGLTDPEYVCCAHGKFLVFSDSLLYICPENGEIEKTVSLSGMTEMTAGDICDAECTDGGFASSRITVKKAYPFKNGFTAVITGDNRSYLMHSDDEDFYSFEKTYENVIDVCGFDNFAYYLCRTAEGYGIIKTAMHKDKFETAAKYLLCTEEKNPIKLISGEYGIGVLYADGSVKFILPELSDSRKKNRYKNELKGINTALSEYDIKDIFSCGGRIYLIGDSIYTLHRDE